MKSEITSGGAKAAGNFVMEKALAVGQDKCHAQRMIDQCAMAFAASMQTWRKIIWRFRMSNRAIDG